MSSRRLYKGVEIDNGFFEQLKIAEQINPPYTTNGTPGDQATYKLFTVTGLVFVHYFFGVCNVNLVGAATIDIGTTSDDDIFSPTQLADATVWDAGMIWDGTTAPIQAVTLSNAKDYAGVVISGDTDNIIETIAAADISAGQVNYYCVWTPMVLGASVVPTEPE